MEKMAKRVVVIYGCLIFCFAVLVLRLLFLSQDSGIGQSAAAQGTRTIEMAQSRGMIYDCRFSPIVNLSSTTMLAVRPGREAAAVLLREDMDREEREALLEKLSGGAPFVMESSAEPAPQGEGVSGFSVAKRYTAPFLFPHVVGYVDYAGSGVSGIEKACDEFLTEHGTTVSVSFPTSAVGTPLQNENGVVRQGEEDKQGVVLAIDATLQRAAYYAAEKHMEKGAVLVMDVENGDIKAMVSLPDFDPEKVEDSLDAPDSPLLNRCTLGYSLGSIFKIVTAACALENGYSTGWSYECPGYIDVEGQIFRCHNLAGHGEVNMREAMEESCNPYFIALSLELGAVKLYETAYRLGFGQYDEIAPGMFGAAGNYPKPYDIRFDADLANLGFGQGTLLATPLQVGKLLCAVANGGRSVSPTLLLGYSNEEGTALAEEVDRPDQDQVLSEEVTEILRSMLVRVVEEGSGKGAMPLHGGAGGKTGSAQTGHYDEEGKEIVQAWFAGYYPADTPRYAIVVFIEGGDSGALQAAPVFQEICDYIYIYEEMGEGSITP